MLPLLFSALLIPNVSYDGVRMFLNGLSEFFYAKLMILHVVICSLLARKNAIH